MHPLLTFTAGILAGLTAVRMIKDKDTRTSLRAAHKELDKATHEVAEKTRAGIDSAQSALRNAAIASLSAVERSSASLRTRLTPAEAAVAEETSAETTPTAPTPKPRRAPRRKAAPKPAKARSDAGES